jgi:hypothetical protein
MLFSTGNADALSEPKGRTETPLPWRQLGVLCLLTENGWQISDFHDVGILLLLNLAEPMSASIIYPFIAQVWYLIALLIEIDNTYSSFRSWV